MSAIARLPDNTGDGSPVELGGGGSTRQARAGKVGSRKETLSPPPPTPTSPAPANPTSSLPTTWVSSQSQLPSSSLWRPEGDGKQLVQRRHQEADVDDMKPFWRHFCYLLFAQQRLHLGSGEHMERASWNASEDQVHLPEATPTAGPHHWHLLLHPAPGRGVVTFPVYNFIWH